MAPVGCLSFMAVVHGSSTGFVACGSSNLQYLSFMAPVSVVYGSSICHLVLCLQYLLIACGSGICRSWLQYLSPVSPVVHGSSICSCRLWLQYLLSLVAPVDVVSSCGSSLAAHPVVSPVIHGSGSSSIISCCSWLWQ